MDTEAMLKEATGDTLRSAAIATNGAVKATGKVADLRRLLQGHAETWRPPRQRLRRPRPQTPPRRPPPPEASTADQVGALESELRLLKPYASTKGLGRLKARVDELRLQIHKLTGLPVYDD